MISAEPAGVELRRRRTGAMGVRFRGSLRRSKDGAMSARALNVAILLLLLIELTTGLGSFLVGEPDGRWIFWLHRAGGLALVVLLFWKAGIAASSYRRRGPTFGT